MYSVLPAFTPLIISWNYVLFRFMLNKRPLHEEISYWEKKPVGYNIVITKRYCDNYLIITITQSIILRRRSRKPTIRKLLSCSKIMKNRTNAFISQVRWNSITARKLAVAVVECSQVLFSFARTSHATRPFAWAAGGCAGTTWTTPL